MLIFYMTCMWSCMAVCGFYHLHCVSVIVSLVIVPLSWHYRLPDLRLSLTVLKRFLTFSALAALKTLIIFLNRTSSVEVFCLRRLVCFHLVWAVIKTPWLGAPALLLAAEACCGVGPSHTPASPPLSLKNIKMNRWVMESCFSFPKMSFLDTKLPMH